MTAIGGSMLGMALPLAGFGGALVAGKAEALGLPDVPMILPFAVMIIFSAALLGFAGVSLLLLLRTPSEPRPVLDIPRSRRRELPVATPRPAAAAEEQTPAGLVTTRLVAFAGAERRVRITGRLGAAS